MAGTLPEAAACTRFYRGIEVDLTFSIGEYDGGHIPTFADNVESSRRRANFFIDKAPNGNNRREGSNDCFHGIAAKVWFNRGAVEIHAVWFIGKRYRFGKTYPLRFVFQTRFFRAGAAFIPA